MSRSTLVHRVNGQYLIMRYDLTKLLENVRHLCLTADCWTCDGKSRAFFGVTAHWIKDDLTRESVALACRRFTGSHTYDRIAKMIDNILKEYKISVSKVRKCVTDNGSNFVKAFLCFATNETVRFCTESNEDDVLGTVRDNDIDHCEFIDIGSTISHGRSVGAVAASTVLDDQVNPSRLPESAEEEEEVDEEEEEIVLPPHQRCISHSLNLIPSSDMAGKGASKIQRLCFGKLQAILKKQSMSTKASEDIKSLLGVLLFIPVVTRWNSYYHALCTLLKFEDKLPQLCQIGGVNKFSDAEIEFMHHYKNKMKPLAQGLDRLQGESHTFYGELIPTLIRIENSLNTVSEEEAAVARASPHPEIIGPSSTSRNKSSDTLATSILGHVRRRFSPYLSLSSEHFDAIIAAISHPYHKLWWVPSNKYEELKCLFISVVIDESPYSGDSDTIAHNDGIDGATKEKQKKDDSFFNYKRDARQEVESINEWRESVRSKCIEYLNDKRDNLESLNNYPLIKEVFIKYNTALPSSAPVERLWSFANMVLSLPGAGGYPTEFLKS